jgi:hypothetical protein
MDTYRKEVVTQDPVAGVTEVQQTSQHIASPAEVAEARTEKKNQVVWYIVAFIDALLIMRMLFLLLGARSVGFANILYSVTAPFTALFKGIFPTPHVQGSYFDTAAVLAIVVVTLLGWALSSLINLVNRPAPVAN